MQSHNIILYYSKIYVILFKTFSTIYFNKFCVQILFSRFLKRISTQFLDARCLITLFRAKPVDSRECFHLTLLKSPRVGESVCSRMCVCVRASVCSGVCMNICLCVCVCECIVVLTWFTTCSWIWLVARVSRADLGDFSLVVAVFLLWFIFDVFIRINYLIFFSTYYGLSTQFH